MGRSGGETLCPGTPRPCLSGAQFPGGPRTPSVRVPRMTPAHSAAPRRSPRRPGPPPRAALAPAQLPPGRGRSERCSPGAARRRRRRHNAPVSGRRGSPGRSVDFALSPGEVVMGAARGAGFWGLRSGVPEGSGAWSLRVPKTRVAGCAGRGESRRVRTRGLAPYRRPGRSPSRGGRSSRRRPRSPVPAARHLPARLARLAPAAAPAPLAAVEQPLKAAAGGRSSSPGTRPPHPQQGSRSRSCPAPTRLQAPGAPRGDQKSEGASFSNFSLVLGTQGN